MITFYFTILENQKDQIFISKFFFKNLNNLKFNFGQKKKLISIILNISNCHLNKFSNKFYDY